MLAVPDPGAALDCQYQLRPGHPCRASAWRAAGAKPEDRPPELQALFGNRQPRPEGARPPGEGGDRPRGEGGMGAGAGRSGGRGSGGFGGSRGPGGGSGRLSFSLYHTWHLTESITIAPGVPQLNLLDGDATETKNP